MLPPPPPPLLDIKRYTNEILEQYRRDGKAKAYDPDYLSPLPPHVYAIADNAYRLMNNPTSENQKRNQSILVRRLSVCPKPKAEQQLWLDVNTLHVSLCLPAMPTLRNFAGISNMNNDAHFLLGAETISPVDCAPLLSLS